MSASAERRLLLVPCNGVFVGMMLVFHFHVDAFSEYVAFIYEQLRDEGNMEGGVI